MMLSSNLAMAAAVEALLSDPDCAKCNSCKRPRASTAPLCADKERPDTGHGWCRCGVRVVAWAAGLQCQAYRYVMKVKSSSAVPNMISRRCEATRDNDVNAALHALQALRKRLSQCRLGWLRGSLRPPPSAPSSAQAAV
jgi:hypothetical protein